MSSFTLELTDVGPSLITLICNVTRKGAKLEVDSLSELKNRPMRALRTRFKLELQYPQAWRAASTVAASSAGATLETECCRSKVLVSVALAVGLAVAS